MSGPLDSHAAVFTSSPQSVEVFQAGTWWQGELLGWRHDAAGACQMWVRVVVGGVEEVAWTDLASLRLPEQRLSPAPEPSRVDSRVRQELPTAQVVSALRSWAVSTDAATTAALPMIRDEVPAAAPPNAAPAVPAGPRSGGRRRASEDADVQVADASAVSVPPGRHRAGSRDEGRHRAADTEVFAAVVDDAHQGPVDAAPADEQRRPARGHTGAGWTVPAARTARPEESHGRSEVCTGRIDAEPDLLTRPMRLGGLTAGSRRPRVGRSVAGA